MTRRRIILLSGILIFFGTAIVSILLSRRGREADEAAELPSEQVRVFEVNNREIPTFIEITGRLAAEERIDIYSEVGGVLLPTTPAFRPGNTFSQGQTLIRIDDSEFRQNLIASRSSFLRSITMLMPDIRLDFTDNYENWLSYLEQFNVNRPLPPLPEPATSQERYFLTGRNIYTQYHEIRQIELRLNKYRIRAPFNGTVTDALITQGTLVMQGQRLGEFIKTGIYELESTISGDDLQYVRKGQKVELQRRTGQETWQGEVVRIGEQIDPATQSVRIFIRVADPTLRDGMFMSGRISAEVFESAEVIPRDILVEGNNVFILREGRARLKEVTVVHQSDREAIVKGLQEGELVIEERRTGAFEGTEVEPVNGAKG